MDMENDLVHRFAEMPDDELLEHAVSGKLSESALALLTAQLRRRGLLPHAAAHDIDAESDASTPPTGYRMLVRGLTPVHAQILLGRLHAEGIDAHVSGAHVTQIEPLWFYALGGVRIFVRRDHLVSAFEAIDAIAKGGYEMEDAETGDVPSMDRIERKRVLGWRIVLSVAVIIGGLSLLAIWWPTYRLLSDSMLTRHLIGNWLATAAIVIYAIYWWVLLERMIARQRRPWRRAKTKEVSR